MTSGAARERAAQAWCDPRTSQIEMDTRLAEVFAEILGDVWSQPWLGNATTDELLTELRTRIEIQAPGLLEYRTASPDPLDAEPAP